MTTTLRINDPLIFKNRPHAKPVPNRLAKGAMSEALGTWDNRPTQKLVELYRRWAEGGIGLSITGNVMIDRRYLGEPGNVVIEDDRDMDMLRAWAQACTSQGGHAWMQINHPGKQCPRGLNKQSVAPSAIPFRKDLQAAFATPRELTHEEIVDIIARWGKAAGIAKQAGFTGIQIHGAHGYLIGQFLSPHHNQRTDQWGGSVENRRRFVMGVYQSVRAAVGDDFPVGIKLNSADFQRGGFSEEESLGVIEQLAAAGIDLFEISGGTYEDPAMTGVGNTKKQSTVEREAYFIEFTEKVRARVDTPLMLTGGFRTVAGMNQALASGSVDVIGLARPLAIEPDLPLRLLQGQNPAETIRPQLTGIPMIDRAALMEIQWYTRQLHRMGKGREPKPNESARWAFLMILLASGLNTFKSRRARA